MSNYTHLKRLAKNYLKARHIFLTESEQLPDLSGNDNIVGRVGELIALGYLRSLGRKVEKNKNPVEKGYDLITDKKGKISVKIITAENKSGRTTKIKAPWSEFIFIKLNHQYEVEVLGHITRKAFAQAFKDGMIKSEEPYTDVKMLKEKGLFDLYGNRMQGKEVNKFL